MRIMFLAHGPRERGGGANAGYHEAVEPLLNSYASPGTQVDLCYPDDFEGSGLSATAVRLAMCVPALIRKAVWAQENGYDAVIQSHTMDPGVEESRFAVRIPVIGALRTALYMGANLARRTAILVPFEHHIPLARRAITAYGMDGFVSGIRSLGFLNIRDVDLVAGGPEILDRAVAQIRVLVSETGAECVIPLGGALIPYIVSPADIEAAVGVPVLNTKSIAIRFTEMCVQLRLVHSARAYPADAVRSSDLTWGER